MRMNGLLFCRGWCGLEAVSGVRRMDVRPDMGERAWLRKGYDFGVTGVGVVGGAGGSGAGDSGLKTRCCSWYISADIMLLMTVDSNSRVLSRRHHRRFVLKGWVLFIVREPRVRTHHVC
jgi:hypothetical protein